MTGALAGLPRVDALDAPGFEMVWRLLQYCRPAVFISNHNHVSTLLHQSINQLRCGSYVAISEVFGVVCVGVVSCVVLTLCLRSRLIVPYQADRSKSAEPL